MILKTTLRRHTVSIRTLLFPLLKKSVWAVGDQGLFAGAHFILNILLARWLTPEAYGAFAVAYSAFLVLVVLHDALLVQPLLVYGTEEFRDNFAGYLRALVLWGNGAMAIAGGLLLAGAGLWLDRAGAPELARALIGAAVAQPFILFLWLVRRATYARNQQHQAAAGGIVYIVLVLAALYAMHQWSVVSPSAVFLILGVAGLVVGIGIMWGLGALPGIRVPRRFLRYAFWKHWRYGRWASGTGVMNWTIVNGYILLLPLWEGLGGSGAFKALMNLVQPALHVYMAFSVLLIPEFVKARAQRRFRRKGLVVAGLFLASGAGYWLLVGGFGSELVTLLYGGGQYEEYSGLLWLLGAMSFVEGLKVVLEAMLRAIERPDWLFWAYLAGTIATLTVGFMLLALYGLTGATLGIIISSITVSGVAFYFVASHCRATV